LALAQQTADQAIAEATREADDLVSQARRQAEQITSDARARAESQEREDQERHRRAMGSLEQQREELERRVDDLRALEAGHRSRLREYAEGLLHDLAACANGAPAIPQLVSAGGTSRQHDGEDPAAGEDA
jgi:F0F1-type ATP synthase membrane subunit b/b'